jgi:hypothetical protein
MQNTQINKNDLGIFRVRLTNDIQRRIKLLAVLRGVTVQALMNSVLDKALERVEVSTR